MDLHQQLQAIRAHLSTGCNYVKILDCHKMRSRVTFTYCICLHFLSIQNQSNSILNILQHTHLFRAYKEDFLLWNKTVLTTSLTFSDNCQKFYMLFPLWKGRYIFSHILKERDWVFIIFTFSWLL